MTPFQTLVPKTFGVCLLLLLALFFGCTNISPEEVIKSNPQIKSFLVDHPNAEFTVSPYPSYMLDSEIEFWEKNCAVQPKIKDYFVATIEDRNTKLRAIFGRNDLQIECGVVTDNPKSIEVDTVPESGLKTCEALSGVACNQGESCSSSWVVSKDYLKCCTGTCVPPEQPNPCDGVPIVRCNITTQNCVEQISTTDGIVCGCSKCELKTCQEMGGSVCASGLSCLGDEYQSKNYSACCVGTCFKIEVTYSDTNLPDTNNLDTN